MAIQQVLGQAKLFDGARARPGAIGLVQPSRDPAQRTSSNTLRLRLLGSPQLALQDRPIVLRTRKTLALLVYLAVQGERQPREHLADLLWPTADIDDARASLRTALVYARQALGHESDDYLATTREYVGLHPHTTLDLDVEVLAEMEREIHRPTEVSSLRLHVEAAIACYRGPFLAGLSVPDAPDFEAWMEWQRIHWRGVAAQLLQYQASLQLRDGEARAALTTLERWTSVDHDDEAAWHQLIELRLRCDDWTGARRAWQQYHEVRAELGVGPSRAMAELAEGIGRSASASHHRSVDGCVTGLDSFDVRAWSFIGKYRESSSAIAAFERSRLGHPEVIVLEGAAGVGKTRLVSQFLQSAKVASADVIMGRALDTVHELPYAAVMDALRTRIDQENAPDDLLDDLWLAELARLLPELRERYPDLPASADDPALARGLLFEAVTRLIQALGERKPLVLCLDDVQWIDSGTRDLLRYSTRRWTDSGTAILIILVVRSEDLGAEWDLAQWINGLERDAPTLRLVRTHVGRGDPDVTVDKAAQ